MKMKLHFEKNYLVVYEWSVEDRGRLTERQTCKLSKNTSIINVGLWMEWSSLTRYSDVIMSMMASQIISVSIVFATICSGADQRKHQSSVSLAFVKGIQRSSVDSPQKGPVTWKIFPFDDVIMKSINSSSVIDNSNTILWAGHVHHRNSTGYTESIVQKKAYQQTLKSATIFCHISSAMLNNSLIQEKVFEIFQHCACWWPSTIRCKDICRHNIEESWVSYTYSFSTW